MRCFARAEGGGGTAVDLAQQLLRASRNPRQMSTHRQSWRESVGRLRASNASGSTGGALKHIEHGAAPLTPFSKRLANSKPPAGEKGGLACLPGTSLGRTIARSRSRWPFAGSVLTPRAAASTAAIDRPTPRQSSRPRLRRAICVPGRPPQHNVGHAIEPQPRRPQQQPSRDPLAAARFRLPLGRVWIQETSG